ncbi:Uncharacterised protein [Mycobacteroides abscessus subsp. abscessus]|nr:Uncharacterised protein [Mycobacteroides abscessus subsp. abscessus]SKY70957.1 Uncharacterised protein [Mycobacteroides abscessus subsp. abscessus]
MRESPLRSVRRPDGSTDHRSRGCRGGAYGFPAAPVHRGRSPGPQTHTNRPRAAAGAAASPGCAPPPWPGAMPPDSSAAGRHGPCRNVSGTGRSRSRTPARPGFPRASHRNRCRPPHPGTSARCGRTGVWWRWSPRRSRRAHPAAAVGVCPARPRSDTASDPCVPSTDPRKPAGRPRSGRALDPGAPGWPHARR